MVLYIGVLSWVFAFQIVSMQTWATQLPLVKPGTHHAAYSRDYFAYNLCALCPHTMPLITTHMKWTSVNQLNYSDMAYGTCKYYTYIQSFKVCKFQGSHKSSIFEILFWRIINPSSICKFHEHCLISVSHIWHV